uniref:Nonribosomal peptide synthetase n=1 Tax=Ramalina conduplicans TaxID=372067 RepID=A0A1W6BQA0_9LECA|nr:nonribosomal peptide synthetase [Ramalina conduplicans]
MATDLLQPPYGRRLLPCILDEEANHHPKRTFATIPRSNNTSEGFQNISFLQVANAVNHVAHQLRARFGTIPESKFETITFLGIPDLSYNVVFYAAVKCGYKVLLPSPRNALATNLSLMEQTRSSKVVYGQEMEALFNGLVAAKPELSSLMIGSLDELLNAEEGPVVPYQPDFDEAVDDPIVVLHSSGSTGLPKPVVMTHGTFAVMDNDRNFPTVPGRKNHDLTLFDFDGAESRIYEPFPPFHVGGFFYKIVLPLYTRTIPVFGPSLRPPSGALVATILKQQHVRGCILPPAVAEQLLHEPDGLDCFKQLDVFCYAGGPLSQATGDIISSVTSVCQFYGGTEIGQVRQLVPQGGNWPFMEFHPNAKIELRPSDDDAYEMIIFPDEGFCGLNHNFPEVKEWQTKDLFKQHPTKENLWRFHGRKDDIIVLSSGEKLYPVPMEKQLEGLPNVSGSLITGHGRFQPALLLESKEAEGRDDVAVLDGLWPAIESANKSMPGHGRVTRQMILLAKKDKPFVRAGKGTIVRKLTEKAYAEEIGSLYASKSQQVPTRAPSLVATAFTSDAVENLIRSILLAAIGSCKAEDDLYVSGLDSLKTIEAVETLRASLSQHRSMSDLRWLSAEMFYSNPSIAQLSRLVLNFLNSGKVPVKRDRIATMSGMLERFAVPLKGLPRPPQVLEPVSGRVVVAITGTTGTLGPYLLESLFLNPMISEIWCLNRSSAAKEHWQDHSESRGLDAKGSMPKLNFVTVQFGSEDLGIHSSDQLKAIQHCDLIVHNAWKVDFKQDVTSFTENLQSMQTLAKWSTSSPRHLRVIFLSSVSSVDQYRPPENGSGIPEAPIEDLDASLPIGYAESKRIAERLLDRAAADSGASVSILRVGQIGGPAAAASSKNSRWSVREAIPAMLKTSNSLQLIPSGFPPVDWIPVDVVSKIVAELSLNDIRNSTPTPRYYNVVNPHPVPWQDFIPSLKQSCGPEAQVVPLTEWTEKLRQFDANDAAEVASKPALKMLDFYAMMAASAGGAAKYQTQAAVEASETMKGLEPVSASLMAMWVGQCG